MFRRPSILLILASAMFGIPYVANETTFGRDSVAKIKSMFGDSQVGSSLSNWASREADWMNVHHRTENLWDRPPEHPHHNHDWLKSDTQALAGGPFRDFRDILRFDATPAWVTSQFSRVTTVLADRQLEGLRVPVVTGARPDDIAGTVTYYFTNDHRLQRVTLNGFTGDPTRLVSLMLAHYHLRADHSLGAGGYSFGWNKEPTSLMKITPTPVIYAQSPNSRFTVFLELNQPNKEFGISYAAQDVLANAKGNHINAWPQS